MLDPGGQGRPREICLISRIKTGKSLCVCVEQKTFTTASVELFHTHDLLEKHVVSMYVEDQRERI